MPSPCISICKMSIELAEKCQLTPEELEKSWPDGVCEGCFRTMHEIIQWGTASKDFKETVWQKIKTRSEAAGQPYIGFD
jgi:predicted Fe-S protein YdhL (DUF1289 family)